MPSADQPLPYSHPALRRAATYASVAVAATLIVAKLGAFFMTDSIALLSSMIDSAVDLLTSAITAFAVARALRPPDRDHRYGHGKAEPLAAMAQAAFITGSSILLMIEAIGRVAHPHALQSAAIGYETMALAVILTLLLLAFQAYVVRKTSSLAIGADRLHYVGDVAINLAVVAAFALQQKTGLGFFDPLFAAAIAFGMLGSAWHIVMKALNILMDRELPDEDRARIAAAALAVDGISGVHDLRTRTDSGRIFIEIHIEIDGALSVRKGHKLAEKAMKEIDRAYPNADIVVHQDPDGEPEARRDAQIDEIDPPPKMV
jgi:ferrous-iron efflux pump FieF